MVACDINAIRQSVANYIEGCVDFIQKSQITAIGQKQVAIGMDPAAKDEVRTGEEVDIGIRKNTKLEDRDDRHFHLALHVNLLAASGTECGGAKR